ncbi:alcohol oxidase AOX1 [Crepidotus variabilis]|uniref:pyranose dehydrogenase (acceptor) n=1 Tax=Crepidotus variabilis TaxID=179855 RepID=A0A9P6ERN1_9AGAR|nr:alcohol oxidase AOX1 [Crepidotus variabilis]
MAVYDIIFAGGGAAACVTAGRLAEADPSLKILILESGPHSQDIFHHIQPARYYSQLNPAVNTGTLTFTNVGRKSEALLGRTPVVPSAHAVGGGSSVNFAVYTRAAASDYDDWESVYGNKGWGSDKLIPLIKKSETYQGDIVNDTHGTSGPIKVSFSKEHINVGTYFLEAAAAYDKNRTLTKDTNDFHNCDKYVDGLTGRRSDTAHNYIYNKNLTNVKVSDCSRVVRVLFEGTRAVGVEYVKSSGGTKETLVANASRLVVVSSGAFGSPAILERSGIGSKDILEKNGLKQFVDLPGVGEHYMDHNVIFSSYHGSQETETMDHVFRGTDEDVEVHNQQWYSHGTGLLTQNALDAGGKLRPTKNELNTIPEFEHRWKTYHEPSPDKPVMVVFAFSSYGGKDPTTPIGKYFSLVYFTGYPVSTGSVHITAGLDPFGSLDFNAGFLNDAADVAVLRWAYKRCREYARRMKLYRGEVVAAHPKYPEGSSAAARDSIETAELSSSDIVYSKEDDDAIDKYHRENVETSWHSCGTCAMKPRSQGGVVDERLNVYGVQGLKVADVSIAPGNVGANTYGTALAIGEKAAVIIAEDLGIKGVTPS